MRRELALIFALLTGCSSYQIPEQETARLQIMVYQNQLKEVNLEDFFENHEFPELKDHFFYVLYHLEQQEGNYVVDKKQLTSFFKKHNFDSSVPLDDLEKIVRENSLLKIYTGGFSENIPGSRGRLSLCASENLCFYSQVKRPGHRSLNLALGSLTMEINFPYNLACNIKPEVKALEIYEQGAQVIFYCQCLINGQMEKSRFVYHTKHGTSSELDGWEDPFVIDKK
ncbi:hypothetical protein KY306_00945 [Candidatus Woesearchaeota archaeon]|nr:hypothetical protein [Candidatus Woesearchaeota archaeon]